MDSSSSIHESSFELLGKIPPPPQMPDAETIKAFKKDDPAMTMVLELFEKVTCWLSEVHVVLGNNNIVMNAELQGISGTQDRIAKLEDKGDNERISSS